MKRNLWAAVCKDKEGAGGAGLLDEFRFRQGLVVRLFPTVAVIAACIADLSMNVLQGLLRNRPPVRVMIGLV